MVDKSEAATPFPAPKPLPSVDIPLFAEERRSIRVRTLFVIASVALSTLMIVFVVRLVRGLQYAAAAPAKAENKQNAIVPSEQGPSSWQTVKGKVGKVRTFTEALLRLGLNQKEVDMIIEAFSGVTEFRTCRPDDEITIDRDTTGKLVHFEYRPTLYRKYEASLNEHQVLVGKRLDVPIKVVRIARSGRMTTSLSEALTKIGLGASLSGTFSEAFANDPNFAIAGQSGDAFRIIVDQHFIEGKFLGYGTVHAVEWIPYRKHPQKAYWFTGSNGKSEFYTGTGRAVQGSWLRIPLRYERISSRFDPKRKHPMLRKITPHLGVDYAGSYGTPVWASAPGVIAIAGRRGVNGNLVTIRHAGGYETGYAHLSRIARGIAAGKKVNQRQVVGYVGSTGRSTGPHLHFSLKHRGRFVDPVPVIHMPGRPLAGEDLKRFQRQSQRLDRELAKISIDG